MAADDNGKKTEQHPEVEEMLAELEGRSERESRFPEGFVAVGNKLAPAPRWTTRFVASGTKPAR